MNFVGRPSYLEAYDLASQQAHLVMLAKSVNGIIETQDWNLGTVPAKCLEIKVDLQEGSLHWSMHLAIETAEEAILNKHKAPYFWEQSDVASAIRKDLSNLDRDVERLRKSISAAGAQAWDLCRTRLPPGTDGAAYPGLDGKISCGYSCSLTVSSGKLRCPSCGETLLDNSSALNRWGLLSCCQCDAVLAASANQGLGIPDGVRAIVPGELPDQAVQEVMSAAHKDDWRFKQFGPFKEWKEGALRLYAAFREGRIVGFSTWNDVGEAIPAIRIVWVHSDFRRQGLGRLLLDAEARATATFAVEAPSEDFDALLESTGYLETKKVLQAPGG